MGTQRDISPQDLQRVAEKYCRVFICLMVLSIAGYGMEVFNLIFVAGDWSHLSDPHQRCRVALSVGRWVKTAIWHLSNHQTFAPSFTLIFTLVCWALSSMVLATLFGAKSKFEVFMGAALVLVHPILATHTAFPSAHLPMALGMLGAVMSIYWGNRWEVISRESKTQKRLYLLFSSACLAIALGVRPSFFLFTAVGMVATLLSKLSGELRRKSTMTGMQWKKAISSRLLTLALGGGTWFTLWQTLKSLYGIPTHTDPHYAYLPSLVKSLPELSFTTHRLLNHLSAFLFEEQHLFSMATQLGFLLILCTYLICIQKRLRRGPPQAGVPQPLVVVLLLVVTLLLTPWMIGWIRLPESSYHFTARLGLVPLYSLFAIQTLRFLRPSKAYGAVALVSLVMVLSFAQTQSRSALVIKNRLNREAMTVSRIIQAIESHPQYPSLKRNFTLYVIGEQLTSFPGETLFSLRKSSLQESSVIEFNSLGYYLKEHIRMVTPKLTGHPIKQILKTDPPQFSKPLYSAFIRAVHSAQARRTGASIQIYGGDVFLFLSMPPWLASPDEGILAAER